MFFVFAPKQYPDATYWPGRRLLASLDAVGWPALWGLGAWSFASTLGATIAAVVISCAAVSAVSRFRIAVWRNERYRFSTWRLGKVLLVIAACGIVLKALS